MTFASGGTNALGGWGSNILATLIVADTLGNRGTNTWSFNLEIEPAVVANLFVFGSPKAQATGQRIGDIPTASLARRFGPISNGAGDPWTLELVESNRLVLSYTNTAPGFVTNTYVCNLTPVRPGDIFNRKITAITDDPGNKLLTLFTVEVPLTEIVTNGAVSVSTDSVILEIGTNTVFAKAFSIGGTVTFPRIGYSLDGTEFKLKDPDDFEIFDLTLEDLHWWLTPRIQGSIEIDWGGLQRFEAIASGNIDSALVWNADVLIAGVAVTNTLFELPEGSEPKTWIFLGAIGPVPVYASLGFDVQVKARAEIGATLSFRAGERQTVDAAFGLTYNKPDVQWVNTFNFSPPEVIPFTANINAEGSLKLSMEPTLEFLVYGASGVSAGITPSGGVVFEAGTGMPLSGRLEADVSLDLGLAGPAFDWLNPKPELSLPLWHDEWHLFPDEPAISFTQQPQSQTVPLGGSAYFSCTVAASGTPAYQWYFNGVPMPGQNARTLLLPSVTSGHAGNYQVRVTAGGQTTNSASATLIVMPPSLQSGLVAYYPFNGNANDASGNEHNGTLTNSSWTFDRFGSANSALRLTNPPSAYAFVKMQPFVQFPTSEITAAFWMKSPVSNRGTPVSYAATNHGHGSWDNEFTVSRYLTNFYLMVNGYSTSTTIPATDDHWCHIAMTWRSSDGLWRLFRDGTPVASGGLSAGTPMVSGGALIFGQEQDCLAGCFTPEDQFVGSLDDMRMYNRALSATEIQQLYNLSLPTPPSGMALIPAGSFTMGDNLDGDSSALPPHSVYVSALYMERTEVTKSLWDNVYQWATNHGYSFGSAGSGKAENHPVYSISWSDAVKWCNARSEMENMTPAYYTNAAQTHVYRSGALSLSNDWVNWNAGYRLPTEAEWEKAARGGWSGQRFPWGNTISHNEANYYSDASYFYDVSLTRAYNPAYYDCRLPGTSPVGSFMPNGYGLYDMAGNVEELCWDRYAPYESTAQTDPRGPSSGSGHVLRGGDWANDAADCRAAWRWSSANSVPIFGVYVCNSVQTIYGEYRGFRTVLPPGQ